MGTLSAYLYQDETACVEALLSRLDWRDDFARAVQERASLLVKDLRSKKRKIGELESFLQQYGLNTEEGLALMTLAEALLRIPDHATANALIKDKMVAAEWLGKQGGSKDLMVKAAGLGLSITRKTLDSAAAKLGEPVIRKAMVEAIRMLGRQFVLGRTIEEGLKQARDYEKKNYHLSYDMLGEGARTMADAGRYFEKYESAILALAKGRQAGKPAGMSIKLSALYPRYEFSQKEECVPFLIEKAGYLAQLAAQHDLNLTIDAEEVDRLNLSLEIFKGIYESGILDAYPEWQGFGLAVQAYQKRSYYVLELLREMVSAGRRKIQVRLVKGAYWDSEIKRAQILGLEEYPVFTRKCHSDASYLDCAKFLLTQREYFYPMFATHNAHTVAAILEMAGSVDETYEFQRLHGMGEILHDRIVQEDGARVCVYAPCGSHEELLPYLVRRLLENGASTSFVHKILDESVPIADVVSDPIEMVLTQQEKRHHKIPLPKDIYGAARLNSAGTDLNELSFLEPMRNAVSRYDGHIFKAAPIVRGKKYEQGALQDVCAPFDHKKKIGQVYLADEAVVEEAFLAAKNGFDFWSHTAAQERAACLLKLADLLEVHGDELMALCVYEAGKTYADALAELREAVDFCRYYAQQGARDFSEEGFSMPGPTGESNILTLHGRGVFVCISPWNFPLAIFTGQICAALMAGNAVIAKPASPTPLIAARTVELMLEAGIPADVISFLPGSGALGAYMVAHKDVAGVCFTGSTQVAWQINRALAAKDSMIVPLIAETGGQNAMIVDSTALAEQVVDDVILSAFGSAGQRCSALRVLFLQEDVAEHIIEMLKGALALRNVGNPTDYKTDIGPVIDERALSSLKEHKAWLEKNARFIASAPLDKTIEEQGTFLAPVIYEIPSISELSREVFGPVLHIVRFKADRLQDILKEINDTDFGLTFGVHSRIQSRVQALSEEIAVGNVYVNRSMIGAVVGVQPFGGRGLSGTGPKAGGPFYLHRFANEKLVSIDTTRQGGNASLVTLEE